MRPLNRVSSRRRLARGLTTSVGRLLFALAALAASGTAAPAVCGMIDPEWLVRYDAGNGFDRSNAMAVTADGVYLTGDSDYGEFLSEDMYVAHYTRGGELVWAATYAGLEGGRDRSLAIAPSGEVFISGVSWGGDSSRDDIVTIKYSPDGVEQWVARWDGAIHHTDRPYAVAVDGAGGVVVTGWTTIADEPGLSETAFITIRYDGDGGLLWAAEHTGTADIHRDTAYDVAVDEAGEVYVTGSGYEAGRAWDMSTVKYRGSDGQLLWKRTFDHSVGIDEAFAIAVADGAVCITGSSSTDPLDGQKVDAVTIRYDTGGTRQWVAIYDGPAGTFDEGQDVVLDPSGDVYVVGSSGGIGTGPDFLTVRYNPQGQPVWIRTFNGPRNSYEFGKRLALDGSGNVFATGTSHYYRATTDVLTLMYRPDGDLVWLSVYDGPSATNDLVSGVGHDGAGGVYICGHARYAADGTSWDAFTIKYPVGDIAGIDPDGIDPKRPDLSAALRLGPPAPNPFTEATTLSVDVDRAAPVRLEIHDAGGRRVRLLEVEERPAGRHRLSWDGNDGSGRPAPAGMYFVTLRTGGARADPARAPTRRVVLVR